MRIQEILRALIDIIDANEKQEYSNQPNEEYADVDAITKDMGGGPNAPKHPHDIRVKDPSAYPNQQEY